MKIRIGLMLSLWVATTLNAYAQTARDLGRTAVTPAVPYRVALVVGNKDYSVGPLTNPVNDAQDMAATLNKLGFNKVILRTNRTAKDLESDIREFGDELRTNGVGFFYYSGHGMQIDGRNYLLPIDVNPKRDTDVKYDAVDAGRVLDELERKGTAVNLVVLDACRNNPFSRSFRSTSRGLARMDAPSGTLIVYATRPGQVAEDGKGRNGTFTKHLLAKLNEQPDLEVRLLLSDVRAAVLQETGKTQEPWEEGGLVGQFRFASAAPVRIEPLPRQALSYLTLTTKPSDARVKILNIAPGYQEGMALSPGDYHVEVAAEGYQPHRQWMELGPGPQRYDIDLVPLRLEPQTGKEYRDQLLDGTLGPEMVIIPAGNFSRERSLLHLLRDKDEPKPDEFRLKGVSAEVRIDKAFGLGKYEVTFEEYDRFAEATRRAKPNDKGWGRGNRPVINVSYEDAREYANWLSEQTGKTYRLPTEVQWEYAARARTDSARYWGDNADQACEYENVRDKTLRRKNGIEWPHHNCDDGEEKTAKVGRYKANGFGLHDVLGNVSEWTCSRYTDGYDGISESSCLSPNDEDRLALRGGSWQDTPDNVRSAARTGYPPGFRNIYIGFRLAQDL